MYELPQYVNISQTKHKKYTLYAYGEGKSSEAVYKGKFIGIPVLFIPGNSGSFRQVRSLASIALRKAIEDIKYKVHFDCFAVDFVEEFSALYGGTLEDQAAFVRQSIADILSLYQGQKQAPTSVVLIDPNFDPLTINLIITLATPHSAPVLNADKSLNQFYEDIDNHWNDHRQSNHVSLVSIGGGVKDIQVRPGLTWSDHADLNVQTTAASGIWVSADHRCIV
jgi:glycosylphosphatidylinositol deacylase